MSRTHKVSDTFRGPRESTEFVRIVGHSSQDFESYEISLNVGGRQRKRRPTYITKLTGMMLPIAFRATVGNQLNFTPGPQIRVASSKNDGAVFVALAR
jgi:hypothetical protein